MANEIKAKYSTGANLYAIILSSTSTVWNGTTFETIAAANWATYDIALTENSTTGIYSATFPITTAGIFDVWIYVRSGGSPATTDSLIGQATFDWDGTAELSLSNLTEGNGEIPVDEDYGGTDELAYKTDEDVGIAGATITIYLTSDYEAGNRSSNYVIARVTTVEGGKWDNVVFLSPNDYTLIYALSGQYGPDRRDITVVEA